MAGEVYYYFKGQERQHDVGLLFSAPTSKSLCSHLKFIHGAYQSTVLYIYIYTQHICTYISFSKLQVFYPRSSFLNVCQ